MAAFSFASSARLLFRSCLRKLPFMPPFPPAANRQPLSVAAAGAGSAIC